MTALLHTIFTPKPPPPSSIYEVLIDLIEQAEHADETGHPVEALVQLTAAKARLVTYLAGEAN